MKVAVASDDGNTISAHLGRCRSFVIYEVTEGKAVRQETIENTFTPHMQKGGQGGGGGQPQMLRDGRGPHGVGRAAGGHGALMEALEGVEVLIARGMGPRLVNELSTHGIRTVFSVEENIDVAIQMLAEGKLEELGDGGTCER